MDTVPVGNAGEWSGESYGGDGPDRICGAMDHAYNIGKYEVTAGQYTEFLNAVAATDTYGLYNTNMWNNEYGCKIERMGESGSYSYFVAAEWANRPVNYVSWGDAARFANWLHNDQLMGAQDLTTTEDGSYYLNGAITDAALLAVAREPGATWVVPSEDEWYKTAYHRNDGVTGNYWDYPMGSNTTPDNGNPGGDTGNSANLYDGDYTIGSPYWRTDVGYFGLSNSPYGAFDMGGNVWEWNEAVIDAYRGVRGGSSRFEGYYPQAAYRYSFNSPPTIEFDHIGFRVAEVPEPGTIALLALAGAGVLGRRRR
jgi:sulfatase modifying factor 1